MVYDEGFNIDTQEWTFFAFSKYSPNISKNGKTSFKSKCYQTCVGWYANKQKNLWGCYYATKKNVNINSEFVVHNNVLQVLEPTEITRKEVKNKNSIQNYKFNNNEKYTSNLNRKEKDSELNRSIVNTINEMTKYNEANSQLNINTKNEKIEEFTLSDLIPKTNKSQNEMDDSSQITNSILDLQPDYSNFLELNIKENLQSQNKLMSRISLTFGFKNHMKYIQRLNKLEKSWNADLNHNFKDMTILEMNKFAGIPKSANRIRFKQVNNMINLGEENKDYLKNYPENFDWRKYLRSAGSQGNCGSCYAYSTTRMTEARLLIKYNHKQNLSVQHNLDCAFYNQGCSGGYPFLVMKFASQFEMIPEECKPYIEMNGKCNDSCNKEKLDFIYKLNNYKYVGGSYGQCNENYMMEELYNNGPLVVSFEPDYNFMLYKTGIYHSISEDSWKKTGAEKPEWQKVDHSVLLVGWGVDSQTKEKYWLVQNTWGPFWGEQGYFRIKRGSDELGIESICESADPIIIDNKTKKELTVEEYNNLISNKSQKNVHNEQKKLEVKGESIFSFLTDS